MWGQGVGESTLGKQAEGPKTGAREPDSKNKVVVCFLYSALLFPALPSYSMLV